MSYLNSSLGFSEFLRDHSDSLLNFYDTGIRYELIVDVPVFDPYHTLTNKFIKQMIDSKRLDIESFNDSVIEQKLLIQINTIVHDFIHDLYNKKQLTAYIEGLR